MATILITGPTGTFAVDGTTERLLTPTEVARMFRVDPKTVNRWANAGKLSSIRTLGGYHRYRESEVLALLRGDRADIDGRERNQTRHPH